MRERLIQVLKEALLADEQVLAFWEAGSKATGISDQYSDLDLQVIVTDGHVAETVQRVEAALATVAPTELRYEVPQPSWHGHWQAFYRFEGLGPFLLVDFCVMEEKATSRFLEPEMHGTPSVIFDRKGLLQPPVTDAVAFAEKLTKRLPLLEVPAEMFHAFVDKEIMRGREVDALGFYQGLVVPRLIEALRLRYSPWRHNFGLRYLWRDLPAPLYAEVRDLLYVAGVEELQVKKNRAVALLRATLAEVRELDLVRHLEEHR